VEIKAQVANPRSFPRQGLDDRRVEPANSAVMVEHSAFGRLTKRGSNITHRGYIPERQTPDFSGLGSRVLALHRSPNEART
jgi:hypothetical protein